MSATTDIPYETYVTVSEPSLIGAFVGSVLFGIGLLQFWICFRALDMQKHAFTFWFLVFLFLADMADTCCKLAWTVLYYRRLIYLGVASLGHYPKITFAYVWIGALIVTSVQAYYLRRLVLLTPHEKRNLLMWAVVGGITLISGYQFVMGTIDATYPLTQSPTAPLSVTAVKAEEWQSSSYVGAGALADILITAALCINFIGMRKQTEYKKTHEIIARWVSLTLETGLITALAQIVEFVMLITPSLQTTGYFYVFACISAKLYVNSILVLIRAVLDGRQSSSSGGAQSTGNVMVGSIPPHLSQTGAIPSQRAIASNGVHVRHDVEHDIELGPSPGSEKYGYSRQGHAYPVQYYQAE